MQEYRFPPTELSFKRRKRPPSPRPNALDDNNAAAMSTRPGLNIIIPEQSSSSTSAATSMVRLPSIDHGLSPFPDGFMPLRRGSLTDPGLHAHTTGPTSSSPLRPDQPHFPTQAQQQQQQQQYSDQNNYYATRHSTRAEEERDASISENGPVGLAGYSMRRPTPDVKPLFPQSHHHHNQQANANANGEYYASPNATSFYSHEPLLGKRKASIRGNDGDLEGGDNTINGGSGGSGSRSSSDRRSSDGSQQQQQQMQGFGSSYSFPPPPLPNQHQYQSIYTPGHSATQSPAEGPLNFEGYSFGSNSNNGGRNSVGHYGNPATANGGAQIPRVSFSDHDGGTTRGGVGNASKASSIFSANASGSGDKTATGEGMSIDGSNAHTGGGGGAGGKASGNGSSSNPVNRVKAAVHKETPYSRTPELRVSHKIAERKRRKEMKELFDDLRDTMPAERGVKTSKWEVLSKSVDYIGKLHNAQEESERTIGELKSHIQHLEHMLAQSQAQQHQQQQQQQQQQRQIQPLQQQQPSYHQQQQQQQQYAPPNRPGGLVSPQHSHLHLGGHNSESTAASPVSSHSTTTTAATAFSHPHNHHLQYPSHPGLQPHHSHPGYGDTSGTSLNQSQSGDWPSPFSGNQHSHLPHQQHLSHHRSHSYPHPTGSAPPVIQSFEQAAAQSQQQDSHQQNQPPMSAPSTAALPTTSNNNLGSGQLNSPLYRPASINSHNSSHSIHSIHSQSPQLHNNGQQQQQQQQPMISPPSQQQQHPLHQQHGHGHGHSMSQSTIASDFTPFSHAPPPAMSQQQQQEFGNGTY